MERIKSTFLPSEYVKTNVRFAVDRRLVLGKNLILTRDKETIDTDSFIFLGKILEHTPQTDFFGFDVWLDVSYPYVILIPGRRGTGKSYTMGVLVEGLTLSNQETPATTKNTKHAVVLFDTLGQFWQMKYPASDRDVEGKKQLKNLKSWGLNPKGVAQIQVFVPVGRKIVAEWKELVLKFSEVEMAEIAGLLDVDLYQDRMGQLLNHVYTKVREEGYQSACPNELTGTLQKKEFVGPKKDFSVQDLIDCIDKDLEIMSPSSGFEVQTRRALRSRLQSMSRWKVFSDKGTPISDIFRKDTLTIVNLEGIDEDLRNLIVAVLTRKIFQAREISHKKEKLVEAGEEVSVSHEVSIPPGWLVVDEAHEFCPSVGRASAKEPLIRFAKEGRSLGLGLILATQQPSALSEKLSSQVETIICHALAFNSDIQSLKGRLVNSIVNEFIHKNEVFSFDEQVRLLSPGAAMISAIGIPTIFLMQVRPRLSLHGGKAPRMG